MGPLRVDIVSDVVCPWCAIGYYQLAKAAAETGIGIDVHWQPFELNPHMADEGENCASTSQPSTAPRPRVRRRPANG